MRAAAHVLATLVLAPYLALAVGFLLLGHVASQGSLGGLLLALIDIFIWMVPWGVLALVAALGLVGALFFFPGTRKGASIGLGAMAALILTVIVVVPGGFPDAGQLLFLLPCVASFAVGVSNSAAG